MTHPSVLHLFLGDGVVLRHLCFSVPAHPPLRYVCTGLQRYRLPDAWGHGSLYSCIPSAHTPLRCVCTGLRRWRLPDAGDYGALYPCIPPHKLRSAAYVRGYRDSVFQTHGAMGLSILASPHILRSAAYVRG